ncbi:hypothetical protein AVEN_196109-1 [Araneus ventricosus]|uniref:Uncharacterized protein n=1 Tax=Araneus ventricosus TaxID=182803 RepID=A0A4Y2HKN5_ARAVE|nr:hypothetical protein AVEN_196109-1 [Araneus ventricosus]
MYKFRDFLNIRRCNRYQALNHTTSKCSTKNVYCGSCAGLHDSKSCREDFLRIIDCRDNNSKFHTRYPTYHHVFILLMWAPRNVDELLRFHMKELACLGLHKWGGAVPPPVIVRTSYGRGRAVRLCWPVGPNLSTHSYCNDCHSDFPYCLGRSG